MVDDHIANNSKQLIKCATVRDYTKRRDERLDVLVQSSTEQEKGGVKGM